MPDSNIPTPGTIIGVVFWCIYVVFLGRYWLKAERQALGIKFWAKQHSKGRKLPGVQNTWRSQAIGSAVLLCTWAAYGLTNHSNVVAYIFTGFLISCVIVAIVSTPSAISDYRNWYKALPKADKAEYKRYIMPKAHIYGFGLIAFIVTIALGRS